jgi:alkylation response protein AidB-like acyl-CoA dehydrogenase
MSLRSSVMGLGLRALNRLASLPGMDRPETRRRVAGLLHGASHAGFSAALAMNRPFKAARQLLKPLRPAKAHAPDLFDLTPTDEQAMIADAMRRFAADALRPGAAAADEACAAPPALLEQAAALGLAAMNVPDELGGAGTERSAVTNALVAEALAHGDLGLALACLSGPSVATAIAEFGSAAQQAQYLPSLTGDRPAQAAIALMEGGALFNPFQLATRAVRKDGGYVLEGEKHLVAMAAQAELFLVAAADEDAHDAPALFLVESGSAGLEIAPQPAMGLRAAGLCRLRLRKVKVAAGARLGGGDGADDAELYAQFIALSRLAWSALAVGTTQAVLDYVIPYANQRQAFGEPISHRQSVAFMIANIGIELEGMRLATWRAASLAARGKPFAREAVLARSLCARHGMQAGSDGVQVLGGHGFVKEHPVERWYRDLRAVALMEGGVLL